ncbi:MAG: hypothetical protein LBP87_08680 [Planctomycetaceae bacterium]|nr:hypothetical protein [Planctomycetaceae bacterium]
MAESQTELTFIHFLRAGVLLTTLILVPATAVCWNMIPKNFWEKDQYNQNDQTTWISPATEPSEQPANTPSSEKSPTESLTEPPTELPATLPANSSSPLFGSKSQENKLSSPNNTIKTTGGINNKISEQPIPNSFKNESSIAFAIEPPTVEPSTIEPSTVAVELPKLKQYKNDLANHQITEISPQRNFPILENQLKQLGAKYYRLEKWGSRGELFRFSCFVSPSEPYQYQKYFQAIDSDELRVMESVIEEIKRWKKF